MPRRRAGPTKKKRIAISDDEDDFESSDNEISSGNEYNPNEEKTHDDDDDDDDDDDVKTETKKSNRKRARRTSTNSNLRRSSRGRNQTPSLLESIDGSAKRNEHELVSDNNETSQVARRTRTQTRNHKKDLEKRESMKKRPRRTVSYNDDDDDDDDRVDRVDRVHLKKPAKKSKDDDDDYIPADEDDVEEELSDDSYISPTKHNSKRGSKRTRKRAASAKSSKAKQRQSHFTSSDEEEFEFELESEISDSSQDLDATPISQLARLPDRSNRNSTTATATATTTLKHPPNRRQSSCPCSSKVDVITQLPLAKVHICWITPDQKSRQCFNLDTLKKVALSTSISIEKTASLDYLQPPHFRTIMSDEMKDQIVSKFGRQALILSKDEEKQTENHHYWSQATSSPASHDFHDRLDRYVRHQMGSTDLYCCPLCYVETYRRFRFKRNGQLDNICTLDDDLDGEIDEEEEEEENGEYGNDLFQFDTDPMTLLESFDDDYSTPATFCFKKLSEVKKHIRDVHDINHSILDGNALFQQFKIRESDGLLQRYLKNVTQHSYWAQGYSFGFMYLLHIVTMHSEIGPSINPRAYEYSKSFPNRSNKVWAILSAPYSKAFVGELDDYINDESDCDDQGPEPLHLSFFSSQQANEEEEDPDNIIIKELRRRRGKSSLSSKSEESSESEESNESEESSDNYEESDSEDGFGSGARLHVQTATSRDEDDDEEEDDEKDEWLKKKQYTPRKKKLTSISKHSPASMSDESEEIKADSSTSKKITALDEELDTTVPASNTKFVTSSRRRKICESSDDE